MDLSSIGTLVSTVGFPIAMCLIFLWVFYKIGQTLYEMWGNDIKPTLDKVQTTQIEVVNTLKSMDCRITNVEADVNTIKNKLDIK